ncbi:MAG: hypothetical protein U0Z44_01700 [Kouleothrix sp.]
MSSGHSVIGNTLALRVIAVAWPIVIFIITTLPSRLPQAWFMNSLKDRAYLNTSSGYPVIAAGGEESNMPDITLLEAIRQGIDEMMAHDPRIFVFGEDVGKRGVYFRVTEGLYDVAAGRY